MLSYKECSCSLLSILRGKITFSAITLEFPDDGIVCAVLIIPDDAIHGFVVPINSNWLWHLLTFAGLDLCDFSQVKGAYHNQRCFL